MTYDKQLEKRLAKSLEDVVDFNVQLVRLFEGPPPVEDGVCHFQHTGVDLGLGSGESTDEILRSEVEWVSLA